MVEDIDFDAADDIKFNRLTDHDKKANFLNKRKKVLKGTNFEEGAMTIERNNQIGGHKA